MNLKEQIENYEPYNEQEKNDKEIMLSLINRYDDVLTRENKVCHFTASNWIVNKERTKILMAYHNIYHSWAWTGGHCDGDADLLEVALKEAREETGITSLKPLDNSIYGIAVLPVTSHIKREKYVPTHLHLDCCFLSEADENSGVKWIDINKILEATTEELMIPIYHKLNQRLLEIK